MSSYLSQWILNRLGWKIENHLPDNVQKYIVVVAPHTSSWDFPLGLLVRSVLKRNINFVGKKSLFKPPHGILFRWLGGVPVDRSKSNNFVDAVVDMYNDREAFAICITPEGTRKKAEKLKSGFYYIAKGAQIPIVFCTFDFENKIVTFKKPLLPTGTKEEVFEEMYKHFRGVKGKIPENGIM